MDNREFDQLFGDKLTPEQPFDFRESDWEEVSMVLDKDQRRDKLGFWFWPALLGVLSIATIMWLFNDLQNTKKLVKKLETQAQHNNIIITDTLRKNITIIEYDTIRKTTFVEEKLPLKSTIKKASSQKENITSWTTTKTFPETTTTIGEDCNCPDDELIKMENQEFDSSFVTSTITAFEKNDELYNKLGIIQKEEPVNTESIRTNRLNVLAINILLDSINVERRKVSTPEVIETPSQGALSPIRKKRFKIGIVAGYQFPKKQASLSSDTIGNQTYKSYQIGLRTEYDLTNHWTISADLTQQNLDYQVNGLDTIEGVFLERILPDGLDTVRFQQKNWNYTIGLKYRFGNNPKIQPYTSLHLHAQSNLEQDGKGQVRIYGDPSLFEEKRSDHNFRLQGLEPTVGLNYHLKRNLSWQLEGHYLFHFNKKIDRLRNGVGVRTALLFHF